MENRAPMGSTAAQQLPLEALMRFMNEGMAVAAVAHSYHVEALMNPRLNSNPQFQRFSLIELNELHHQVAALGSLLRLQHGDSTALASLGSNLAGFLQNRQAGLQAAASLPAEVTQNPAVQMVMRLTQQSNQQVAANMQMLNQVITASGGAAPGALLVRCPS